MRIISIRLKTQPQFLLDHLFKLSAKLNYLRVNYLQNSIIARKIKNGQIYSKPSPNEGISRDGI